MRLGLVARDDVVRPEAVVDVDAHAAPRLVLDLRGDLAGVLGEIADVPDAGLDAVLVAQQASERPALAGDSTMTSGLAIGVRSSVAARRPD